MAGPSTSPRNRNGHTRLSVPKTRSASPDSDVVALDAEPPTFRSSRSPEKPRQNARAGESAHHPMAIANLASPGPIRVEGQPSIPSLPSPSRTPRPSSSSRPPEQAVAEARSSQLSEDVTMDEGNENGGEDEDVGNTTVGAGDDDGEEDEEGEGDEDEEESEDDEEDESGDDDDEEDIELVGQTSGSGGNALDSGVVKMEPGEPTAPGDTATGGGEGDVNTLQPKKQKSRRKREASEDDMPPPPPPMQTIRLEYKLKPEGEESEWNVLEAAQAAGLVPKWASNEVEPIETDEAPSQAPTQVPEGSGGILDQEGLSAEEIAARIEAKYGGPKKKVVKKKKPKEDYDFNDDFIDDSEIAIDDAETHVPRPVKEGFFVHAGAVEILSAPQNKTVKKPQAKKARIAGEEESLPSLASATASRLRSDRRTVGTGTSNDPLSIDEDDALNHNAVAGPSSSPVKRDSSPPRELIPLTPVTVDRVKYHAAVRDSKYLPPFPIFPPEVQQGLLRLRQASEDYPWTAKKNPFPTVLRPAVRAAGRACFENEMLSERHEERRQGVLTSLCSCLPYNATTLRKLFYRLCQQDYWDFLQECEDTGITRLEELVAKEQDKWIVRYEEAVEQYKSNNGPNGQAPSSAAGAPMIVDNEDEEPSASAPGAPKSAPTEPKKLSVWSQEMKETFGQLIDNYQDMVDLNKQIGQLDLKSDRTDKEFTETNMKSRLYKRVIDIFPEGYTSSTQVSRYSSSTRKNNKKQQPE